MAVRCPKCGSVLSWHKCIHSPFSCSSCGVKLYAKLPFVPIIILWSLIEIPFRMWAHTIFLNPVTDACVFTVISLGIGALIGFVTVSSFGSIVTDNKD